MSKWGKDGNEFKKMDDYYDRYDEGETVIRLKFKKRCDVDINALLSYINLGLKQVDYLMKDLEIDIN